MKAIVRYEHFLSQNEGSSYANLTQFQVQYRKDKLELKIGNFNETLGLILLRNSNPFGKDYFYSLLFSGSVPGVLSCNFEYAHNLAEDLLFLAMDEMIRYGMYGSLSFNLGSFGMSFEYKNYHNLLIGSGISDPPTAVREHKYKVLNRSTHVPQLVDESGIGPDSKRITGSTAQIPYRSLLVNAGVDLHVLSASKKTPVFSIFVTNSHSLRSI